MFILTFSPINCGNIPIKKMNSVSNVSSLSERVIFFMRFVIIITPIFTDCKLVYK